MQAHLSIVAANVLGAGGALDGDGNGVGGDNRIVALHRFFGDSNGDGAITAADFLQFRLAFQVQPVNSLFDFDGDGQVSGGDFLQFRLRFQQMI